MSSIITGIKQFAIIQNAVWLEQGAAAVEESHDHEVSSETGIDNGPSEISSRERFLRRGQAQKILDAEGKVVRQDLTLKIPEIQSSCLLQDLMKVNVAWTTAFGKTAMSLLEFLEKWKAIALSKSTFPHPSFSIVQPDLTGSLDGQRMFSGCLEEECPQQQQELDLDWDLSKKFEAKMKINVSSQTPLAKVVKELKHRLINLMAYATYGKNLEGKSVQFDLEESLEVPEAFFDRKDWGLGIKKRLVVEALVGRCYREVKDSESVTADFDEKERAVTFVLPLQEGGNLTFTCLLESAEENHILRQEGQRIEFHLKGGKSYQCYFIDTQANLQALADRLAGFCPFDESQQESYWIHLAVASQNGLRTRFSQIFEAAFELNKTALNQFFSATKTAQLSPLNTLAAIYNIAQFHPRPELIWEKMKEVVSKGCRSSSLMPDPLTVILLASNYEQARGVLQVVMTLQLLAGDQGIELETIGQKEMMQFHVTWEKISAYFWIKKDPKPLSSLERLGDLQEWLPLLAKAVLELSKNIPKRTLSCRSSLYPFSIDVLDGLCKSNKPVDLLNLIYELIFCLMAGKGLVKISFLREVPKLISLFVETTSRQAIVALIEHLLNVRLLQQKSIGLALQEIKELPLNSSCEEIHAVWCKTLLQSPDESLKGLGRDLLLAPTTRCRIVLDYIFSLKGQEDQFKLLTQYSRKLLPIQQIEFVEWLIVSEHLNIQIVQWCILQLQTAIETVQQSPKDSQQVLEPLKNLLTVLKKEEELLDPIHNLEKMIDQIYEDPSLREKYALVLKPYLTKSYIQTLINDTQKEHSIRLVTGLCIISKEAFSLFETVKIIKRLFSEKGDGLEIAQRTFFLRLMKVSFANKNRRMLLEGWNSIILGLELSSSSKNIRDCITDLVISLLQLNKENRFSILKIFQSPSCPLSSVIEKLYSFIPYVILNHTKNNHMRLKAIEFFWKRFDVFAALLESADERRQLNRIGEVLLVHLLADCVNENIYESYLAEKENSTALGFLKQVEERELDSPRSTPVFWKNMVDAYGCFMRVLSKGDQEEFRYRFINLLIKHSHSISGSKSIPTLLLKFLNEHPFVDAQEHSRIQNDLIRILKGLLLNIDDQTSLNEGLPPISGFLGRPFRERIAQIASEEEMWRYFNEALCNFPNMVTSLDWLEFLICCTYSNKQILAKKRKALISAARDPVFHYLSSASYQAIEQQRTAQNILFTLQKWISKGETFSIMTQEKINLIRKRIWGIKVVFATTGSREKGQPLKEVEFLKLVKEGQSIITCLSMLATNQEVNAETIQDCLKSYSSLCQDGLLSSIKHHQKMIQQHYSRELQYQQSFLSDMINANLPFLSEYLEGMIRFWTTILPSLDQESYQLLDYLGNWVVRIQKTKTSDVSFNRLLDSVIEFYKENWTMIFLKSDFPEEKFAQFKIKYKNFVIVLIEHRAPFLGKYIYRFIETAIDFLSLHQHTPALEPLLSYTKEWLEQFKKASSLNKGFDVDGLEEKFLIKYSEFYQNRLIDVVVDQAVIDQPKSKKRRYA